MFTFFLGGFSKRTIELSVTSDTTDYNIYSSAGSPTAPVDVILTINSGVTISATTTSSVAVSTGSGWDTESTIRIINNGDIRGKGGAGGAGGNGRITTAPYCWPGATGSSGGDSMDIAYDIELDNTNGNIYGGGGGGGGGGGARGNSSDWASCGGGGGGGGRCENSTSAAGAGGTADGQARPGSAGGTGSTAGAGSGGAGGVYDGSTFAGGGATGGDWGASGSTGTTATATHNACVGGSGGAAGKAVDLNSNTITWLGGNNGTQVKGAVS